MRLCTRCTTPHSLDPSSVATSCTQASQGPGASGAASASPARQTAALPTGMIQAHMRAPKAPPDDGKKLIGRVLGSYKLLEVIGRGGMGHVYAAEHVKLGRKVALKLLKPEYAVKRDAVARFFQEAKAVNKIRHRNIVDVTDFFELPDHQAFIIMELLEGRSLGRIYRAGEPLPTLTLLGVLVQVCEALEAAHAVGIVHRDLKPDNIFVVEETLRDDGVPLTKLLDFGIAKLISEEYDDNDTWRTSHNNFLGTPAFMSPEQAVCDVLDGRSDVYSLGAILYELLCGQPLFEGRGFGDYVLQHKNRPPPPMKGTKRGAAVSREIEAIVLRCLQKAPKDRYQTVAALKKDLCAVLEPRTLVELPAVPGADDLSVDEDEETRVAGAASGPVRRAPSAPTPAPPSVIVAPPRADTPNPSLAWQLAPVVPQDVAIPRPRLAMKLAGFAAAALLVVGLVDLGLRSGDKVPTMRTAAAMPAAEAAPAPAAEDPPAPATATAPRPEVSPARAVAQVATKLSSTTAAAKPAPSASRPARSAAKRIVAETETPRTGRRGKRGARSIAASRPAPVAAPAPEPRVVASAPPEPPADEPEAPAPPRADIGRGETMNPFGKHK